MERTNPLGRPEDTTDILGLGGINTYSTSSIQDVTTHFAKIMGTELMNMLGGLRMRLQITRLPEVGEHFLLRIIYPRSGEFIDGNQDIYAIDYIVHDFGNVLEMSILKAKAFEEIKRTRTEAENERKSVL